MKDIYHPAFIQEWKLNPDIAVYLQKIDKREILLPKETGINRRDSQRFLPKNILKDMKWFPFQGVMLHVAYNIECPVEHLNFLLKVFSIFKIRIYMMEKFITNMFQRLLE